MAKKKPYKNITIHPAQGGALIGSASDDVPITQESNFLSSSANYTDKLNFRRETDGELRREGWEIFDPKDNESAGVWGNNISFDAIDSKFPIRAIHQFPGTDGTPVLITIAGGKVWRLRSGEDNYAQDYQFPNEPYADDPDISGTQEYWLSADEDFYWQPIYNFERHMDVMDSFGNLKSPFDGGAYRWEIVNVQNHVIINNGCDLPIVYKSEWSLAEPLYSLRENGVISVGTIGAFQDRLFCADLTVIVDGYDSLFTSSDPYGYIYDMPQYGTLKVQRYQFRTVYSAEGEPKLFNSGAILNNNVVMESGGLPGTLDVNQNGRYYFTPDYNYKLGTPGSMYQYYGDGIYQGDEAYTVNMVNPVTTIKSVDEDDQSLLVSGIFLAQDAGSSNDFYAQDPLDQDAQYSADYGADNIYGTNDDIAGDYFSSAGEYKLVNTLGDNLVLEDPEDAQPLDAGSYTVVLRPYAEQLRSPAAFNEFAQDGSRILKMLQLADKLVVYRDTGFFFVSKTNSDAFPFAIEPRYSGGRIADFRHTIINVDGNQHIFMGNSGVYSISRSSTEPKPVSMFEIGPPFWQNVPPDLAEFVYTVDNPVTREIFINCPLGLLENEQGDYIDARGDIIYSERNYNYAVGSIGSSVYADDKSESGEQEYWGIESTDLPEPKIDWGVIAYDYVNQTLSTIDASFTSASYIRKPKHNRVGPEEVWFIMGIHQASGDDPIYPGTQFREDYEYGGVLVRYGYGPPQVNQREPYRIYNRLGFGYESRIKSGLIDFGDSFSDKEVRSYLLELSSKYGTTPVRVRISTSSAPQGTEEVETMQTIDGIDVDYVELNNVKDENMIPMYIRAPYIRDEITIPAFSSNPIKIVGRTFEVSGIDSRSTTQTFNQG